MFVRVRSLDIVLADIEVVLPGQELTDQQKAELHAIVCGCRDVLNELEERLDKYEKWMYALTGSAKRQKGFGRD
jgi:hypothetical protein